MNAEKSKCVDK